MRKEKFLYNKIEREQKRMKQKVSVICVNTLQEMQLIIA